MVKNSGEAHEVARVEPGDGGFAAAVLDAVRAPVMVVDRQGRVLNCNRAWEALTGFALAEVRERPYWERLVTPEGQPAARAEFERLAAGSFPGENESHWGAKDGRRLLVAWSHEALRGADGGVAAIVSTGADISERAQNALLLNASESLQLVTTALLQHLTTLDDVLDIICAEACRLTGARGSAVLLLEDERGLRVAGSSGSPAPSVARLPVDDSVAGQIVAQKAPRLIDASRSRQHAYQGAGAPESLLAVPLLVDETVLGVLDVVDKPGGFGDADRRIMGLFAEQAAIAIEHARLHRQAEKLAVIEERQRLARELHDSVTQALYSVTLYADAAGMALKAGKPGVAAGHLDELRTMAREAMLDMRLLIFELHPPVLEKEGLIGAIQARLETVEARSGLQTALQVVGPERRLPPAVEEDLYRIVQEALNNAVKHAGARQVTVSCHYGEGTFRLEVDDDGGGFDPARARQSGGIGLRGIEERVQRMDGRLTLASAPGEGTLLTVEVEF